MTTLFLHIHKTGGTSFSHALQWGTRFAKRHWTAPNDPLAESYRDLSEQTRKSIELLQGHFLFGAHNFCPGTATHITMVRHPVDQIISSYYYMIETFPNTYIREMELEDFAAGESIHRECNAQARRIAGLSKEEIELVDSETLFHRAVDNIENHFTCVGLLERFDESLLLMRRLLAWPFFPLYLREKKTTDRPRGKDISESTRASIAESNNADMRLYAYARRRLDEQMAMQQGFEKELCWFKSLNQMYQRLAPWFVHWYRRLR